jgi:tRNA pseudouridine38-40 synthase
VRAASHVPAGYDTRFHGRGKRYVYTILADRLRDPQYEGWSWRISARLDPERMRAAAAHLLGTHDFKAFRAAADARPTTIRTLRRVELLVDPLDPRVLRLVVEGDRFLYNMVRIIAGTLVDVGAGRRPIEATALALATGERERLGQTAPACGLLLDEVRLDTDGVDLWPPPVAGAPVSTLADMAVFLGAAAAQREADLAASREAAAGGAPAVAAGGDPVAATDDD